MSKIVDNFKLEASSRYSALGEKVMPKAQELSEGLKKAAEILESLESYQMDMDRAVAEASIATVNARLEAFQKEVAALTPIDFKALWPAKAGDTIKKVIASE